MTSTINASSTGSGGIVQTADASGVLALQANGTTAFTVNSDATTTFANAATLSGGTANGVAYLNGSKVLTSGSAFVFDGTNVGIGTSSPGYKLHVANSSATSTTLLANILARLQSNASGADASLQFSDNVANSAGISLNQGALVFSIAGGSVGRFDTSGNLGIGTSSPATTPKMTVQGGGTNGYGGIRILSDTNFSNGANYQAYGRRGDGNTSGAFAGGALLARVNTTPAAVTSNINLGRVGFGGSYDGTDANVVYGAQIAGQASGTYSSTSAPTDLVFYTTPSGTAGGTTTGLAEFGSERMRIDSSGNVGIGTSSPNAKLDLLTTASTRMLFTERGTGGNVIDSVNGTNTAYSQFLLNGSTLIFATGATERARIDSSGNLLVGTSATINTNGVMLAKGGAAGGGIIQLFKTTSGGTNGLLNYYQSTYVGGINYDNTSTSLATSSDIRLKKDIVDAPSAINVTSSIRVVSHGWKHDESTVRYGFVAQELINVAPEAVMQGDDGEEIEKTWTVDYARLVPMLVKTIQEQQALITSLTARIEALESR